MNRSNKNRDKAVNNRINLAIMELYCGKSGKIGFYNSQEIGLAKALVNYNFNVTVVYPVQGLRQTEEEKVSDFITVLKVPACKLGTHAFYNLKFLLNRRVQVVHLDSDNQVYAPSVMKFCKKHNIICYNYIGTIFSDTENALKRKVMDIISYRNIYYLKKYKTFTKTPYVQQHLLDRGVKNVKVIPVGLDVSIIPEILIGKEQLRGKLNLPLGKKILLFVGRLDSYKKPLDAIELINNLDSNYYLVMIGRGSLKNDIFTRINEYNLKEKVRYIEAIPNKDIHEFYKASDFYVNFNDKEIFGMSILEAMYQKCTVVAIDAPGPNFIIEDGISGYINKGINDMVCCLKECKETGSEAYNRVCSSFTWDVSANFIIEFLNGKGVIYNNGQ